MTDGVLHLITTLDRGGAETALLHLVRAQTGRGRQVDVAWIKGPGELQDAFREAGATTHDVGSGGAPGLWRRARRTVRDVRPGVLHTHLFKADVLGAALAGGAGPRLVSTKHNEDVYLRRAHWRALGRRVARRADALVAISPGVERFVRETLGTAPRRLDVIPYGLPPPDRHGDGGAFRQTHGIPADAPLVLCVARLVEQKDHRTLLAALRQMADPPTVVLLGRGELESALRAEADALPGRPVHFVGFAADPSDAYAAADLLVLSSRHEGLGLVILEAAQRGVPALATSVGGVPDVVVDGETGMLVAPGDPAALAAALADLLASPERRATLGAAARRRVTTAHGMERYADRHDALYADLLGAAS